MQNLNNVTLINLDVHLITATKKVDKGVLGVSLPDDLYTGGVVKMFSPAALRDMNNVKSRMEAACEKVGIRCMGGYAIPNTKVKALVAELQTIMQDGLTAKDQFLTNYVREVAEWKAAHQEYAGLLDKLAPERRILANRISFDFQTYKVLGAGQEEGDAMNEGLERISGSMSSQLFDEVAKAAKTYFDQSLSGKDKVTLKALRPLKAMQEKLAGLAFLDHRIQPIGDMINELVAKLAHVTPLEGMNLQALHGVVFILMDQHRMREHGEKLQTNQTTALPTPTIMDMLAPKTVPAPVEAIQQPTADLWEQIDTEDVSPVSSAITPVAEFITKPVEEKKDDIPVKMPAFIPRTTIVRGSLLAL